MGESGGVANGGDEAAVGAGGHTARHLQHGGGFARDVLGVEDQENHEWTRINTNETNNKPLPPLSRIGTRWRTHIRDMDRA
jgi:hypothetical protein